jgi:SEC-C motif-containing protein
MAASDAALPVSAAARKPPTRVPAATPCPCGSGAVLAACCALYHAGATPPDALRLMRARYSAYVLERQDFIAATWHPATRPPALAADAAAAGAAEAVATRWLGLEVRDHVATGDTATVEFVARYKLGGRAHRLHEVSRFVREQGRWWYRDGSFPKEEQA